MNISNKKTIIAHLFVLCPARMAYVSALLAALLTSILRLRQRLPPPQLTREWGARLVLEDASHYVMYALVFVVPPPLTLVLLPVTLFAVLHSSSYTLQLLDLLGPSSAAPLRYLISLVELKSQAMLRAIAIAEIVLMPYTVAMLLVGRGSLLVPFIYYRFLSLRYASRRNPYSRTIFAELRVALERQAASPRCPALLSSAIHRGVALVSALSPPVMGAPQ
ncbi:transmembrane protein 33-like isoform X2 [Amphibalanus amphitrite]|uniref:transmembrane protein 33-like isoform X2 n=1 Tax=Amphibalanus amphitrite TaxID=1232801 RepID=UPI001C909D83|nr:transmembrane protein 33-like isoform X2 [Amphibalanus amphitrite]